MVVEQVAVVSPRLVEKHVSSSPLLSRAWRVLTSDREVNDLLRMSNVNAVERLLYNDHGPVHARIVAGSALEIFDILVEHGVEPSTVKSRTVGSLEEAKLVVLLAAYLHDIGNAVHRVNHEFMGAILAYSILGRLLPEILGDDHKYINTIKAEVMHAIYSTDMNVQALTIEAGIVKVADATDMAEGRARYPYKRGKLDIHALSALAIRRVEIRRGGDGRRPVVIRVVMHDHAGYFQIEKVLMPKLRTSTIIDYVDVVPVILRDGEEREMPPVNAR